MKVFLSILILVSFSFAQNASSREWTIFRKGVSEYQKGNYDVARQSFSLMLSKLPNSALTTANELMLAKTNYKSGDYTIALQQCEEFKNKYAQSRYLDDIIYLEGNCYYRMKRTETAALTWLQAGLMSNDATLQNKALKLADEAIRYKLNRLSIEDMAKQATAPGINDALQYYLADNAYENGNPNKAKNILNTLLAGNVDPIFKKKAQDLVDNLEGKSGFNGDIRIAALLPLSGPNSDVGNALLGGLKMAVSEYNATATKKIEIAEFDYSGRLVDALVHMKTISSDHSILAVFGPVENDVTAACAAIAGYEDIPVISPTASAQEINSISEYSVLLAPTLKTLVGKLETFAYDSLNIHRLATFSPLDDYYVKLTQHFKNAFELEGGSIPSQEWYYPGDQDFTKQLRMIKRVGLKLEFADSAKSEYPGLSDKQVDSLYTKYTRQERLKQADNNTKIDSIDIPVTAFDGFFLPVFKDDISIVAAQFASANFKTKLLGNSDWYDKDALKKNRDYINGIVFVSDGYLNEESWDFRQFRNKYRTDYKKTPGKFELIAYDCFNFLSGAFKVNPEKLSRENLIESIIQLKTYHGIYRTFDIDRDRSNKSAQILKYLYGQIIPISMK